MDEFERGQIPGTGGDQESTLCRVVGATTQACRVDPYAYLKCVLRSLPEGSIIINTI